ncbi:type IV pilus assembly protein PilW [Acidovorax sp. 69]|uniref:PilW family protein n=1 Tax=Acidovorax sp. 69 TaxID=2035202 RepID=UPI000C2415ED|nr:PilW family protein [Acidovorax sp. 69]PJI96840.1 type IV pilus assembly protein PilW [Acidovorax sp. 69]
MNKSSQSSLLYQSQRGLTIIELLVAMTISLVIVIAAAYMYLASRESQRAIDRSSSSRETSAYVMQMLGREIMNAGFYPAIALPIPPDATQRGMYDTYPPLPAEPRVVTDWQNPLTGWPPTAFQTGIFGCDGGKLDVQSSTCPAVDNTLADTIVINYFTSDTPAMERTTGRRFDCTGSDAGGDPSNAERKKNSGGAPPGTPHTATANNIPPQLPIFVSNRFSLSSIKMSVDQQDVNSKSLVCSGNGQSPHGVADATAYQPIISGLEDLQFSYGVYSTDATLVPGRYYTASEVGALPSVVINGLTLSAWQRVTAVRVCVLSRTAGGNTRIADKTSAPRTYLDCSDTAKNQPTGDTITRSVEVFGLRNNLKQYY